MLATVSVRHLIRLYFSISQRVKKKKLENLFALLQIYEGPHYFNFVQTILKCVQILWKQSQGVGFYWAEQGVQYFDFNTRGCTVLGIVLNASNQSLISKNLDQ